MARAEPEGFATATEEPVPRSGMGLDDFPARPRGLQRYPRGPVRRRRPELRQCRPPAMRADCAPPDTFWCPGYPEPLPGYPFFEFTRARAKRDSVMQKAIGVPVHRPVFTKILQTPGKPVTAKLLARRKYFCPATSL